MFSFLPPLHLIPRVLILFKLVCHRKTDNNFGFNWKRWWWEVLSCEISECCNRYQMSKWHHYGPVTALAKNLFSIFELPRSKNNIEAKWVIKPVCTHCHHVIQLFYHFKYPKTFMYIKETLELRVENRT